MDLLGSVILLFHASRTNLPKSSVQVLSEHTISLENRYSNSFVNNVFKDNILLNLAYLRNVVKEGADINWQKVKEPFNFDLKLMPSEVFAFHDNLLPDFTSKNVVTTNAHFNSQEDFKSDGYLVGDGVCHLASLIYWAAKDANLKALAPTNHDFANIPEIPKKYGVAIFYGQQDYSSKLQNLYVTNDKNKNIQIEFNYDGHDLSVKILQEG